MTKYPGYAGYILDVNLSENSFEIKDLSLEFIENYLGGKGFAAKVLYDYLPVGCEPLSPDNIVVLACGPLTGTLAPTGCRSIIATKSPLTGIWLDSNCGGTFGPELKASGFDLVIIRGKLEEPGMLFINDRKAEIVTAKELWGSDTFTTTERIRELYGDAYKVACIGPAGEKLVPLASIQAEGRSYGRGGSGAVLGSKNLKAIVVSGTNSIEIANMAEFIKENKEAYNEIAINADSGGARPKYGTSSIYSFIKEAGVLPVNNFQGGDFAHSDNINEQSLKDELYEQDRACFSCPIACSKYSKVKAGLYKDKFVEGPEFENVWSFGAQCGNSDIGSIAYAEYLCDYYGIDAISAGNTIGFMMECFEKGIVTEEEIGFSVTFGDHEALIKMIEMIGEAYGIGSVIGKGVRYASEYFGGDSKKFAMHVKGLELPAYDPRGALGMGLAYATSDRGGCHLRAWPVGSEVLSHNGRLDPLETEFKAELVKAEQDWFNVINSIGLCLFSTFALGQNQITDLLHALTGIDKFSSANNLLLIGERISNLIRLFNLREGLNRFDDTLPFRLLTETLKSGPAKGITVPLDEMLDDYYLIRGWDELGAPMKSKLAELGLT